MVLKVKQKICRWCKTKYTPDRPLQVVCCLPCGYAYSKEKTCKKTMREKEKNTKIIQESKENDRARNKADKETQKKYTKGLCESCRERIATCVHHYIYKSQSNYLRYHPDNLIPICPECHTRHHKSGDSEIMSRVIANRGIEWEQELQRLRRTPCKLTTEYLKQIIEQLKEA